VPPDSLAERRPLQKAARVLFWLQPSLVEMVLLPR